MTVEPDQGANRPAHTSEIVDLRMFQPKNPATLKKAQDAKGTAFMPEITMTQDNLAQIKRIDNEARARGFDGVADLMEKDYPQYEALAKEWRIRRPRDTEGNYLQNKTAEAINSALYGTTEQPENPDAGGGRAGTEGAIDDALAHNRANARERTPGSLLGPKALGLAPEVVKRHAEDQGKADALAQWAEANGMLFDALPEAIQSHDEGGQEHKVYPTKTGRWLKVTKGFGWLAALLGNAARKLLCC